MKSLINQLTVFIKKSAENLLSNIYLSDLKSVAPEGRHAPWLIGFSPKINDPAFAKYQKNSKRWSIRFSLILAFIALVAFPVYGNFSKEVSWPESLFIGAVIGSLFITIALGQTLKKNLDKTWDGVVVSKQAYKKQRRGGGAWNCSTRYILKIKKDSGGTRTEKWTNSPGLYNYYNVGDKVRHHRGFYVYEKYDKSKDSQILCAACLTLNDISLDNCSRCKCPLLK